SRLTGISDAIHFQTQLPTNAPEIPPDTLTIVEASRLALLRDAQVQIAVAKLRVAEAAAKQSRLLPNPLINLDVRFRGRRRSDHRNHPIPGPAFTASAAQF